MHFEKTTRQTIVVVVAAAAVVGVVFATRGVDGGGAGFEWAVSLRINSTAEELPFDVSVPIVLYLIISSSWQVRGNTRPSERSKELNPRQIFACFGRRSS